MASKDFGNALWGEEIIDLQKMNFWSVFMEWIKDLPNLLKNKPL